MTTTEINETNHGQAIQLPEEFRFAAERVSILKVGDGVILELVKPAIWPVGIFDAIAIDDPAFARPEL